MSNNIIDVAKDFSDMPYGRYDTDGYYNGTRFREEYLYPMLRDNSGKIIVNLNGILSGGSSFLDEAFGGLIRVHGFTAQELKERLIINCDYQSITRNINRYIDEA